MNVTIEKLEMSNFKAHQSFEGCFGEIVKISGKNGEGKSSIGEAITWNLFGIDTLGNNLDPTPVFAYEGNISSTLLLLIEGKKIKLQRAVEDGKNVFYINDIPQKATEYKEFIESLFDRDLFLSIFNPNYFSSQHWKEQRSQLLKYVSDPLDVEVFGVMESRYKKSMNEELKKHSLTELDKLHKDRFKKRDKDIEGARARVSTLKAQLEQMVGQEVGNLAEAENYLFVLEKRIQEINEMNQQIYSRERERFSLQDKEAFIRERIMRKKSAIDQMISLRIEENCNACKQPLNFNAKEEIKQTNLNQLEVLKGEGKELITELQEILEQLQALPKTQEKIDLSELQKEADKYRYVVMNSKNIKHLESDIKRAEAEYEVIRTERNDSQSIIEGIKDFVDKKAALMVDKVNALFSQLSVKLFETQKNESIKQTFEIEMDGKPYQKLSTAEKVRAGIELISVLQKESGVVAPTFVDNAESILNLQVAEGQAIVASVKNHKLKVDGGTAA